jgi:hypothetical protein
MRACFCHTRDDKHVFESKIVLRVDFIQTFQFYLLLDDSLLCLLGENSALYPLNNRSIEWSGVA